MVTRCCENGYDVTVRPTVRPFTASQENQCELHTQVCEARAAAAFVSVVGNCMANYARVLKKHKGDFEDNKSSISQIMYLLNMSTNVERRERKREKENEKATYKQKN